MNQEEHVWSDFRVQLTIENLNNEVQLGTDIEVRTTGIWEFDDSNAPINISPIVGFYISTSSSLVDKLKKIGTTFLYFQRQTLSTSGTDVDSKTVEKGIGVDLSPGQYYLIAAIDDEKEYAESNEANNTRAAAFTIVGNQDVEGCTDSQAHNYNPDATTDDGSCDTCNDDQWNGDEEGTDCGGSLCAPCNICNVAADMTESSITNTEAILNWNAADAVSHYWLYFYQFPDGIVEEHYLTGTTRNRTKSNLNSGTTYCWYLRSSCNDRIDFTDERCFTTTSSVCVAPDQLEEEELWQDGVRLRFTDYNALDPDYYYYRFRKVGFTEWTSNGISLGAG